MVLFFPLLLAPSNKMGDSSNIDDQTEKERKKIQGRVKRLIHKMEAIMSNKLLRFVLRTVVDVCVCACLLIVRRVSPGCRLFGTA